MKIKTSCKCGAVFEASGLGDSFRQQWKDFMALHATICMNVAEFDNDENGTSKVILREAEQEP